MTGTEIAFAIQWETPFVGTLPCATAPLVYNQTDDVIALGWEKETEELDFSVTKRLVFKFGQTEEEVKNKLYERDIVLEFEKKVVYEN